MQPWGSDPGCPVVAQVEHHGVAGKQATHEMRKLGYIRLQQQMKMGIQQRPGETVRLRLNQQAGKAGEKLFVILVIEKNRAFFNSSDDDMVQQTGEVYA
jgi:hypothetical protein